jgi:hypothetical protein
MARGKDLAGLAALGALGMMLSKGKKGSDTSGMDTEGFEGIKDLPRRDTGMSEKEPDENYRNSGPRTSPTASRARATAPSSRSTISADNEAGMSRGTRARDPRDAEAGMSRGTRTTSMAGAGRGSVNPPAVSSTPDMSAYVPRRVPQANSTTEAGMQGYVPRRTPGPLTDVDRSGTRVRYENENVSDMAYKKGGKVSSASSRADGIATKGKTRGRYL